MSGQVNDFALIKLVEAYPILYDKDQARGLKNAELKDRAWREVSAKLKASERACITRWKSIRDRFGKEYRRVQENPDEPTNWDIFPHLLFLKSHYKHGHANSDALVCIKYEPKERKRKVRPPGSSDNASQPDDEVNEEEIDPEVLLTNQQLISLVKEHAVLYDKCKIRDSKNLTAKNDAWREISLTLGITEENCYKRWKKLRDRFAREYRYKQISPSKLVAWVYFENLMFLESHYRKGIPLNVDSLKRKGKVFSDNDCPWGTDYPSNCGSVTSTDGVDMQDEQTMSESLEQWDELEAQALDELLLIPTTKEESAHIHINQDVDFDDDTLGSSAPGAMEPLDATVNEEPEEKLHDVIFNMETVLKQSKDCLHALQQQKQRHKSELESNVLTAQPGLMQKVHILLDGLSDSERNKAERKILRFLCECQIKSLNNEEIEDIQPMQI